MANGLSACLCIRRTGVSSRLNWGTGRKAFAKGMKPYQRCDFAGNSEISIVENAERIPKREFAKRGIDKPLDASFEGGHRRKAPADGRKTQGEHGRGEESLLPRPPACQKVCLDKLKALAGLDQTAQGGYAVFAEQAETPGILGNRIGEAWD